MLGKTHVAFGGLVGLTAGIALSNAYTPIIGIAGMTAGACFGALVPDIDADESIINKKMGLVGDFIAKHIKHRTITHTAYALVLFGLIVSLLDKLMGGLPIVTAVILASSISWLSCVTIGDLLNKFIINKKIVRAHMAIGVILAVVFLLNSEYSVLVFRQYAIGLVIGYASHLFADCCTVSGCPLFSPKRGVRFMKLRTGKHDKVFIAFSSVVTISIISILKIF